LNNYNQLIVEAASLVRFTFASISYVLMKYWNFALDFILQGVDIIVFPEYGITTLTLSSLSRLAARPFLQQFPSINSSAPQLLCDGNATIPDRDLVFTKLSCYARQNAIYVVINVGEIVVCSAGQNTSENGGR
jgi:predicted amidohydrolase